MFKLLTTHRFFPHQCLTVENCFIHTRSFSTVQRTKNSDPFWTTRPDERVAIRMRAEGVGARQAKTFIDVFRAAVRDHGQLDALKCKDKIDGRVIDTWKTWTWQDYWNDSTAFAKSLVKLDIGLFKIINIAGFNSPEWLIANNGSILAGVIPSGVYTTSSAEACVHIASHSKSELLVVEDNTQLDKYVSNMSKLPFLRAVVMYSDQPKVKKIGNVPVYTFAEFMTLGEEVPQAALDAREKHIAPGNCCTLIYTSGTSGPPKGVMLSHDNLTWSTQTLVDSWLPYSSCRDKVVSYLPLSHISAQLVDLHTPMCNGSCTYVAQPDALKGSLLATLLEVRPTIFFGVPRVWEKIEEKMKDAGRHNKGLKKIVGDWAKSVGSEHSRQMQFGSSGRSPWGYSLANKLVFSNVKKALGLDETKGFYSGAAPISTDTLSYFSSLDIPVFEGYGMSECAGAYSMSHSDAWQAGSVGRPLPGTEARISKETGELQIRGRNVFMGYLHMPEQTQEVIGEDGFMSTGDVATIDDHNDPNVGENSGFIKITGRTKEIIITAGAENIAPLAIEAVMKSELPVLSNCLVIGDRRKYLTMLVSLRCEVDGESGIPTDTLAPMSLHVGRELGSTATTMSAAAKDPRWVEYITAGMNRANERAVSHPQRIQKWRMLPVDLCEKNGDLTPTQKIKRSAVNTKYLKLCDEMYDSSTSMVE